MQISYYTENSLIDIIEFENTALIINNIHFKIIQK